MSLTYYVHYLNNLVQFLSSLFAASITIQIKRGYFNIIYTNCIPSLAFNGIKHTYTYTYNVILVKKGFIEQMKINFLHNLMITSVEEIRLEEHVES